MNQNAPVLIWEIAKKLRQNDSFGKLLCEVLYSLSRAMGCEESSLWLLNVKDSRLYVVASVGKRDLTGASLDLDRGIPGAVTRSGNMELIADCASDPRFQDIRTDIPRNLLSLPLKTQYDCLGCLQMTDRRDSDFTRDEVDLCTLAASLIALALEERGFQLTVPESRKVLAALRDISCSSLPDDAPLRQFSLNIYENEMLTVSGESGCGSRTLLRLLNMSLDRGDVREGRFLAGSRDMLNAGDDGIDEYHRGFVACVYRDCPLIAGKSIKANLELTTKKMLEPLTSEEALFLTGMQESSRRMPEELSLKEKQLIGVARALAKKPNLILAEEPGNRLPAKDAREVLSALRSGAKKLGSTLLIATHNPEIALMADRILYMKEGRISRTFINNHPKAPEELVW